MRQRHLHGRHRTLVGKAIATPRPAVSVLIARDEANRPLSQHMRYSLVMVAQDIEACRQTLLAITSARWEPFEVIIVDDGSALPITEDTAGLLPPGMPLRIIRHDTARGFESAADAGIHATTRPWLVVVNAAVKQDATGDKRALRGLLNPAVAMTGTAGCWGLRKRLWQELEGLVGFAARARGAGYEVALDQEPEPVRSTAKGSTPRALFVLASGGVSGGAKVIWNCALGLREAGWETHALLMDGRAFPNSNPQWADFTCWSQTNLKDIPQHYDLAVATFCWTWPVVAGQINAARKVALVQSDEPSWVQAAAETNPWEQCFRTSGLEHILISPALLPVAARYDWPVLGVIPNGVDDLIYYPSWMFGRRERLAEVETNPRWVKPTGAPMGVLTIRKGGHTWFDGAATVDAAVSLIASEFPDLTYTIIGGHRVPPQCALSPERVYCVATYDEAEMRRQYNQALVYVSPSKIEGSSLAVLEAMSCGCPVICTPESSDAVIDGHTALTFPWGNTEALAARLRQVLSDETLANRLAANARRAVAQRTLARQRQDFRAILGIYGDSQTVTEGAAT